MKFYKVPVSDLKQIDPDWENRRMNADMTEAIIHAETLDALVAKRNENVMTLSLDEEEQTTEIPYPVYNSEDSTFKEMLSGPDWVFERSESI